MLSRHLKMIERLKWDRSYQSQRDFHILKVNPVKFVALWID